MEDDALEAIQYVVLHWQKLKPSAGAGAEFLHKKCGTARGFEYCNSDMAADWLATKHPDMGRSKLETKAACFVNNIMKELNVDLDSQKKNWVIEAKLVSRALSRMGSVPKTLQNKGLVLRAGIVVSCLENAKMRERPSLAFFKRLKHAKPQRTSNGGDRAQTSIVANTLSARAPNIDFGCA